MHGAQTVGEWVSVCPTSNPAAVCAARELHSARRSLVPAFSTSLISKNTKITHFNFHTPLTDVCEFFIIIINWCFSSFSLKRLPAICLETSNASVYVYEYECSLFTLPNYFWLVSPEATLVFHFFPLFIRVFIEHSTRYTPHGVAVHSFSELKCFRFSICSPRIHRHFDWRLKCMG